ncbi:hypothetical protein BaRGS_00010153 [Batillaria attramentaria]|uniref:Transmembrane protein n=1 Tax=Batillaria attramentaria TaxID=370345 RepID=A0ABD0LGX9_9CAEN
MRSFSSVQRFALGGMFVAPIMCVVAIGAPHWLVTPPNNFLAGQMGIFMWCVDVFGEKGCEMLRLGVSSSPLDSVVEPASICIALGVICGLISFWLAMCAPGIRLWALGIVCFIAALYGAKAAVIFAKNFGKVVPARILVSLNLMHYGWAFYLYCLGVGLLAVTSVLAFFSAPDEYSEHHEYR